MSAGRERVRMVAVAVEGGTIAIDMLVVRVRDHVATVAGMDQA